MYCPKCGDRLREINGALTCVQGDMPVSQNLEKRLRDCFESKTEQPKDARFSVGGRWFCPACGVSTAEELRGAVHCVQCGRSIGEFIRALVELHPHKSVDG
jgi:hypothetical protein